MILAFAAPWLLWVLAALPMLWLLLRVLPPAPIRRRFPGVALLLGLQDRDRQAERTPWWLLMLRMAALALVILGFAGPVLNPEEAAPSDRPLLILFDGGWAEAQDWPQRLVRAGEQIARAGREGRTVAVLRLSDAPGASPFQAADAAAGRVQAMQPNPWQPAYAPWVAALPEGDFDSYWLSDGVERPERTALLAGLQARGQVSVFQVPRALVALRPVGFAEGAVQITALRLDAALPAEVEVLARGPDPAGQERDLARGRLAFAAGQATATLSLPLPPELRNRVTRFELAGARHAGAVALTDDSLKRRKVALVTEGADREGLQLLSQTHYLRQALAPLAEVIEGGLADILPAAPDVIVLADVARLPETDAMALAVWIEKGGLLLRFAGPRLASSDLSAVQEDPLLPVRLRQGGRTMGGAMSWEEPRTLAPFDEGSPFHGLAVPPDVSVTSQVLAQPDPTLAQRVIAALADGTPLVTRKAVGQGQVVLFHVTANAEWSNLPLSGLFMQMLERLAVLTRPALPQARDLEGQTWVAERLLDARGVEVRADARAGVAGGDLARALGQGPSQALPPGLYAGDDRRVALNVLTPEGRLAPQTWPEGTRIEVPGGQAEVRLKGPALAAGLVLMCLDILATLALSGRLWALGRGGAALVLALALVPVEGERALAQTSDDQAIAATAGVILAYVSTGDPAVDALSRAGLQGLSDQLWYRTAIEPLAPIAVDVEVDELAFFPFLYWPVTADAPMPSTAAYARLNRFLHTGGMILFDTRDGDVAVAGGASPEALALQRIAAGLDIPPLEPLAEDHVLTRSFYLLTDFPGRFTGTPVWAEAPPPDAEQAEGMPFRNLNDGVTPVLIGSNDWASAWAVDENGQPLRPVGRGAAGEEQREYAYRFGINLIMHVLTGNYKSDQVHVPALLERLGE
jgi:Domain of unknown function (DUF4159)/Aerotolerance regulator N-terminal